MKIACTGHRPNKLGNDYLYTSVLSQRIMHDMMHIINLQAIDLERTYKDIAIISGMALGVDTMWAMVAKELGLKLIAAIPFENQYKIWPQSSKDVYFKLLEYAAEIVNVSGQKDYKAAYMQQRNIWMVDNCDLLVAVYNGDKSGGTYNCIEYAKSVNKPITYIKI